MEPGKLPPPMMEKLVFPYLGLPNPRVELGPAVGEDAAVINVEGKRYLVVSSDPIVGADEEPGFYLVHINANDVASKGADPSFFTITVIAPENWEEKDLEKLMREIDRECKKVGASLIGGHTEVTRKFKHLILSGTMFGFAEKVLCAKNIKPGDKIILTKGAGIEGTSILARAKRDFLEKKLSQKEIDEAIALKDKISVVREAKILRKWAIFMHDPTEGGVLGGLNELQIRSGLGVEADLSKIPIPGIVSKICDALDIDPLKLIGSGALLAVLPESDVEIAISSLSAQGIEAKVIGTFVKGKGNLPYTEGDELWRILSW